VLEALATGIPVVTTPVGDNPYFVKDGRNGFLVAVGDPEALAEALARAVSTTEWDTQAIVRDLPAGDWKEVGARIVEFFNERLRAGALIPAVPH
jgi:glycosyltransferase involved in cell wall biosynthesis